MTELNASTVHRIGERAGEDLTVPEYPLDTREVGIVHIGVGGFHRAHEALFLDKLFNIQGYADWTVCGVGLMPDDVRMRDALAPQDGLYTLLSFEPDGSSVARVIGTISEFLFAPEDPEAVLERMTDPQVRIVSMTVTEGGYNYSASTGEFLYETPGVRRDLEADFSARADFPHTMFGYVTEALRRRREGGTAPFTVISCDNIRSNGDLTRRVILAYAQRKDPELALWIQHHVSFPNGMVDSITPATSEQDRQTVSERFGIEDNWPVVSEGFHQWVLEDRFSSERPSLERAGVQMVQDVEPYELMKLRLLNCGHQAMAYLGLLLGYNFVYEIRDDIHLVPFVRRLFMDDEATPTLGEVPGIDLDAYKDELMARFTNPHIGDLLSRIAAEASARIPTWMVPMIGENLTAGRDVSVCAAIVASWARFAEGVGEQGEEFEVVDAERDALMGAASRHDEDPLAFLRITELFGDLADQRAFTEPYLYALHTLREQGARALLSDMIEARRG